MVGRDDWNPTPPPSRSSRETTRSGRPPSRKTACGSRPQCRIARGRFPKIAPATAPIPVSLQITNQTDKPLRFAGYDTLSIKLTDAEGREAARWPGPYASLRHRRPTADDFPLVAPGKSVSFPIRVELFWPTLDDRTLWLRTWHASGSPNYFYERLKPGAYKLAIVYDCERTSYLDYPDHASGDNHAWTGTIETPAIGIEFQAR